ncbi:MULTISPECIES: hypothetical protein [Streptomyces]|uniref:hypothetical protein n=1 Tax=Streptomyces TaxID=1883 RepID=UPI00346AFAD7
MGSLRSECCGGGRAVSRNIRNLATAHTDLARRREVVDAFLADLARLSRLDLSILDD